LLDDGVAFGLAVDAGGVQLKGRHVYGLVFVVAEGVEGGSLSVYLILNDDVIDD